jgi:hypothetical protein
MSRLFRHLVLAVLALLLVGAGSAVPAQSGVGNATFSGRATALQGSVAGIAIPCLASVSNPSLVPQPPSGSCRGVADTGEVSSTGGNLDASLLCYGAAASNDPSCVLAPPDLTGNVVNTQELHATVVSHGKTSDAEAQVSTFAVNIGGHTVTGSLITANASATCDNNGNVVLSGSAQLATLQVDGNDVPLVRDATGAVLANQAVPVAGITFKVNQQGDFVQANGDKGRTVTALEIVGPLGTDIIIAQATADIACGNFLECPGAHQFVTGGGFIYDAKSNKEHFTVAGRNTLGGAAPWGHVMWRATGTTGLHIKNPYALTFYDRNTQLGDAMTSAAGYGFTLTDLTNATAPGGPLAKNMKIEGGAILAWDKFDQTGKDVGVAGEVFVLDLGEPGNLPKGHDYFEILGVGDPIAAGAGFLQGGNIQMHGHC